MDSEDDAPFDLSDEPLEDTNFCLYLSRTTTDNSTLAGCIDRLVNNDPSLTFLDLGHNKLPYIGMGDAAQMGEALGTNTSLIRLSLWGNQLGDDEASLSGQTRCLIEGPSTLGKPSL